MLATDVRADAPLRRLSTTRKRVAGAAARVLLGMPSQQTSPARWRDHQPSGGRFGRWWREHPRLLRCFVLLSLSWSGLYLAWRIAFSLSGANPVLWVTLLVAELYGCWNLAMLAWLTWDDEGAKRHGPSSAAAKRASRRAEGPPSRLEPAIDVYVCTYDEPIHVLEATLAGCAMLRRPHLTYLLDDGRRDEVRELAQRWGVRWVTRADNSHAKAGNINHALPLTDGDLVFVLDADHVPMPDALDVLAPAFADPEVALVQSPHDFSNHDSVQHYDVGRHEQSLFFSAICRGKDRHNAAFWCGSGALLRREALLSVGGVATETIAEDFHTTIKLHRAGWSTRYESRIVVQGRAPHDLASYLLQRDRWARGNLAVFTTPESPLRANDLTFAQRLSYLASLTAYFAGPVRLLLLATLTAVLLTGAMPLTIAPLALGGLWAPATLLSILSGTALCRGMQSNAENSHFELCTAEIFTRALRCAVRPGRAHFKVTPKEGVDLGGWQSLRQFRVVLVLTALMSVGLGLRVSEDFGAGFLPAMHGFAAVFVPALGALELRRMLRTLRIVSTHHQLRADFRAPLETAAVVTPSAGMDEMPLLGKVSDVTPSGIGFELHRPLRSGSSAALSLHLPTIGAAARAAVTIEVKVRSCRQVGAGWRLGARIVGCSEQDHRRLLEYCHVIWPYARLHGPEALAFEEPPSCDAWACEAVAGEKGVSGALAAMAPFAHPRIAGARGAQTAPAALAGASSKATSGGLEVPASRERITSIA